MVGFGYWLLYRQFLSRTLLDLADPLRAAFSAHTARVFAAELAMLGAAAGTIGLTRALVGRGEGRAVTAVGLLSYAVAAALYSLSVVAALTFGWEPDVFVMSTADATGAQVVAAIAEALPLVLQPLAFGRMAATLAAALLFWALQMRLCAVTPGRSAITAGVAAVAVIATQWLVLGVPDLALMTLMF
jgi:hypothetical protein